MAKLDYEKAAEIRAALSRGEKRREIARRYGVSTGCIGAIASGKTWRPR